jgi:outer membrane protein TolC
LNFLHRSKDLYERKLAQSSENLSVSTEKYNLGLIDLIELDRSRISNLQARISLNQNYYNILKKQEQLNQLLSAPIMNRW